MFNKFHKLFYDFVHMSQYEHNNKVKILNQFVPIISMEKGLLLLQYIYIYLRSHIASFQHFKFII